MKWLLIVMMVAVAAEARGPFNKMMPDNGNLTIPASSWDIAGTPLFLTPLLESGNIREARNKSRVFMKSGESYSGFLTVNKKFESNLFFWFFPAKKDAANAPVAVWLQGGPGASSLYSLFVETGPFNVDAKLHPVPRNYSWTETHSMIYIDQPVGTGFSFTNKEEGYARNETQVGKDLYAAITQFFVMFPELQKNDFYITGESYAGKYIPALAYTIHKNNPSAKLKINLKGMAIGDGLCDPVSMMDYSDLLYNNGLIDDISQAYFKQQADRLVALIGQKKWTEAFDVFDSLLNGDKTKYPSYFFNATGLTNYFNYISNGTPKDTTYYNQFLNLPLVRRAIHVGNQTYSDGSAVESNLESDMMQSVKPWIEELLNAEKYRVLFYNGQLDIIVAYSLTESFLHTLNWKRAQEYQQSPRHIWRVNGTVAGYVRAVPGFAEIMVRSAGHMVPYDQPEWAFDMINRFTAQKSYAAP